MADDGMEPLNRFFNRYNVSRFSYQQRMILKVSFRALSHRGSLTT